MPARKKIKLNTTQRKRLKNLKKAELQKLAKLAGETISPNETKTQLEDKLARNSKIASGLAIVGGSSAASFLIGYLLGRKRKLPPFEPIVAVEYKENPFKYHSSS